TNRFPGLRVAGNERGLSPVSHDFFPLRDRPSRVSSPFPGLELLPRGRVEDVYTWCRACIRVEKRPQTDGAVCVELLPIGRHVEADDAVTEDTAGRQVPFGRPFPRRHVPDEHHPLAPILQLGPDVKAVAGLL